jgi:hypothetical protein
MDFMTAVNFGLSLFGMGGSGGSKSGYGEDPTFDGGEAGSAQTGSGFLGLLRTGARHLVDSQKEPYVGAADTSMFNNVRPRSVEKLTRGQPAPGGLSSSQQQLFQQAAVMQALQHYQQNGSRDVNMQSMLNEAGVVSPTSRQGIKTLATRRPDLKSEINVG